MKQLLLLVNPTSGKMKVKSYLLEILKILSAEYAVSVHVTRFAGDAVLVTKQRGKDFDVIIACGGDGTLSEVVEGALKCDFGGNLGYIPCGTTNDFAESTGIPKTLVKAAKLILEGEAKELDFGMFGANRCFTYVASFGAFTEVSYSTDQKLKNALGHLAYVLEGIAKLKDLRSYPMKIDCDGAKYEGDFLFGSATNTYSMGGVLKLKKSDVDLADGYHEVLLVKEPKTPAELAKLSQDLIAMDFSTKSFLFLKGKDISFTASESIPWCVDGEYAGKHETARVRTLHKKLKIFRP
ncbi:MAG: YegS/Rv2252/BmrU family lipid kinase [Clostridia bacterium]|nr:YegS/Rv2252/BmrU family lipid kinase [Clostridia bacterium]